MDEQDNSIQGEGSIRLWLPLSAAMLFLFFALMSAYLDHYSSAVRLSNAIEQRIREQLQQLQTATVGFLEDGDVAAVQRLLMPFAAQEDVAVVVVRDPEGRIIASSRAEAADGSVTDDLPSHASAAAEDGGIVMIRSDGDRYFDGIGTICPDAPWPGAGGTVGTGAAGGGSCGDVVFRVDYLLYLTSSKTILGNELAGILLSTLGSTIALSLLLHWFVTSRLGAIRNAMAAFEAGNMQARVGFGRGDEIGILGNSVDRLFESVQSSAQALLERERDALRAKQEAEAANRSKSEFLANMSHEIRTPMNGILGLTDVLMHSAQVPEQREILRKIQSSGTSLMRIINDVLDFSKIEAGALSFEKAPFSPRLVCEDTINLFSSGLTDDRPAIRFHCGPAVPALVMGDAVRVQQILSNLISNAVKFTKGGEVRVSIERIDTGTVAPDTARLAFTVADTGIGIPREKLDVIFQPFEQADGSVTRRFGGTGLGLTICKQLVDRMGGKVSVESEEGVGSTFRIELAFKTAAPALRGAAVAGGASPAATAEGTEAAPSVCGHVLIVDDNDINRMVAGELLGRLGLTCDYAENGQMAIAKATVNDYDLILMDVQMPGMDGLEATRTIRALGHGKMPIIAFSAHAMPEDIQRAQDAGMDDHIAKPIEYPVLYGTLEKWLGQGRSAHGEALAQA